MPSVRILDNVQLDGQRLRDQGQGDRGRPGPDLHRPVHGDGPDGRAGTLPGHHTLEPTFGLPATWIEASLREEAAIRGYTVVDARPSLDAPHRDPQGQHRRPSVLCRGPEAPQGTAEGAGRTRQGHRPGADHDHRHPARAAAPPQRARLDPRPATILEGIAEAVACTRNPRCIVEHVRVRLARQICAQHTAGRLRPPDHAVAAWEQAFAESIVGQGDERHLAMQPSRLTEFIHLVRQRFEDAAREGEMPVLVTSAAIRPFVRVSWSVSAPRRP